ncbi:cell division protein FtsZ [Aquella oligotrophica]|uniref:Cell division protein FtsZ n=1 Tax=Aquella oligotrophica TaxID=2067065 RepID=A0A2I7N9J1_9NEIS|nr:cell division protein FtsZ [Aquella oligotrophica]AUR53140.1 cell division protein FtsZ [Aquella oligotrophica]
MAEQESNYNIEAVFTHVGEVIKVVGVGGGGCNAVDNMVKNGIKHVEFICANTDAKALSRNKAHHLMQLGHGLTRGLGAGSQPEVGQKSAMEDREKIAALLKGADMLFIAAGMGGGTGTGAAPVIADIARSLNILTVGVVTRPFDYEGEKRRKIADHGIEELRKHVDSLIVIPNEKLMTELDEDVSMREAFAAADAVLRGAVAGITEVIKTPGLISLDFADVKTVMSGRGLAMMGSAAAKGQHRAQEATEKAIYSPLLDDVSLDGAKGVLVNISSAPGALKMREYHEIIGIIQRHIHPEADFKSGMAEIEDMDEEEVRVTVIATGLTDMRAGNEFQPVFAKEDMGLAANQAVEGAAETSQQEQVNDPFANFNKNVFSTPAFFRKNRS